MTYIILDTNIKKDMYRNLKLYDSIRNLFEENHDLLPDIAKCRTLLTPFGHIEFLGLGNKFYKEVSLIEKCIDRNYLQKKIDFLFSYLFSIRLKYHHLLGDNKLLKKNLFKNSFFIK